MSGIIGQITDRLVVNLEEQDALSRVTSVAGEVGSEGNVSLEVRLGKRRRAPISGRLEGGGGCA